ncbi:hypothetical protein ACN4DW_00765 [Corynebacterium macclintockiae]|uniref:hypothetical protein n=1 Tax=Corynebacterium macclintockiae TaxID=2913501 RepID=UPI003EBCFA20
MGKYFSLDELIARQTEQMLTIVASHPVNFSFVKQCQDLSKDFEEVYKSHADPLPVMLSGLNAPDVDLRVGRAILPLVTDWGWVARRVETIQMISNGQTRRRLSVDFSLPPTEELRTKENNEQVTVPLTILRKGQLINLDLTLENDNASSQTMKNNRYLAFQAVISVLYSLDLAGILHDFFRSYEGAGEGLAKKSIETLINQGVYDVICDERTDPSAKFDGVLHGVQESHRHQIFSNLGLLSSALRNWENAAIKPNLVQLSLWILGGQPDKPGGSVTFQEDGRTLEAAENGSLESGSEVLDSSLPVQCLALTILVAVKRLSKAGDQEQLKRIEILCSLLSTFSISYIFSIVANREQVWDVGDDGTVLPRRCLAKLTCDSEETSTNESSGDGLVNDSNYEASKLGALGQEKSGYVYSETKYLKASQSRKFRYSDVKRYLARAFPYLYDARAWARPMNVVYSNQTSSSAHMEIDPPAGALPKLIAGLVGHAPCEDQMFTVEESLGYIEPGSPFPVSVVLGNDDEKTRADNELVKKFYSRPGKGYLHGTSRPSQSRIHLYNPSPQRSLEWLRVWFVPDIGSSPLAACWIAILAWINILVWALEPLSENFLFEFSTLVDISLGTVPLAAAAFGFLWFTTGTHVMTREIYQLPRLHLIWCASISVVCLVCPLIFSALDLSKTWGELSFEILGNTLTVSSTVVARFWFALVLFILIAYISFWSMRYSRFCNQRYENKDYVIKSFYSNETLQREAVSIFETGAWDQEYFTDRFAWFIGGCVDLDTYLSELKRVAKSISHA